jgi:tripartite-type tricarboxylate transporter receptor subunit TctC
MKRLTVCTKSFLLVIVILGFLAWSQRAQAQEYPSQPITLLIGFTVGGGTDVCARIIAEEAGKILGQQIIPVNKPGGGGAVAAGILASSKGDGYTLEATVSNAYTMTPHLESVSYKPLDMIPIIQFGALYNAIVVRSDSPYKFLKDLIDFARNNPGKVIWGHPGIGTSCHLAAEQIILNAKVNIPTVPFAGSVPTLTALLGGHVSVIGTSASSFLKQLKAGTVRVLAAAADERLEAIPDVPTVTEFGYPYGIPTEMYIFGAPKETPSSVVKKLEGAFLKAMEVPAFRTAVENFGMYTKNPLSGEALKKNIEDAFAKNGEIVRRLKIRVK